MDQRLFVVVQLYFFSFLPFPRISGCRGVARLRSDSIAAVAAGTLWTPSELAAARLVVLSFAAAVTEPAPFRFL